MVFVPRCANHLYRSLQALFLTLLPCKYFRTRSLVQAALDGFEPMPELLDQGVALFPGSVGFEAGFDGEPGLLISLYCF